MQNTTLGRSDCVMKVAVEQERLAGLTLHRPEGTPLADVRISATVRRIGSEERVELDEFATRMEAVDDERARMQLSPVDGEWADLSLIVEISAVGNVITFRGQACWAGPQPVELHLFCPTVTPLSLSEGHRFHMPQVGGASYTPGDGETICLPYIGPLALPGFVYETGEGVGGYALLDRNRNDYAVDPGAAVQRSCFAGTAYTLVRAGNDFELVTDDACETSAPPFFGIRHTRVLSPLDQPASELLASTRFEPGFLEEHEHSGYYVDVGPVELYSYDGPWQTGASWIASQRRGIPFHPLPEWFANEPFVSEDMGDDILRSGHGFGSYRRLLDEKRQLGSSLFQLPGYHDPVRLGSDQNWLNRGDYQLAAGSMGGIDGARNGIAALHRAGGRVLYYIEGLIIWKMSRIGMSQAKEWAIMKENGEYFEHYRGFWHPCPADRRWQRWLAETCARIVAETDVDGFFIDSLCATWNHRCFNPAHNHLHPDVWNWGVRELLKAIRTAVDAVRSDVVLMVEGASDLAREFVDGSICHTHQWSKFRFDVPFVRQVHPEMRTYESWAARRAGKPAIEELHLRNAVRGIPIYAHKENANEMAELSRHTRRYYDAYPEILDRVMAPHGVSAENGMAALYPGDDRGPSVLALANLKAEPAAVAISLDAPAGALRDRVWETTLPVREGRCTVEMNAFDYRVLELLP